MGGAGQAGFGVTDSGVQGKILSGPNSGGKTKASILQKLVQPVSLYRRIHFLLTGRRDKGYLWCLLAYQNTCQIPGSLSVPSTQYKGTHFRVRADVLALPTFPPAQTPSCSRSSLPPASPPPCDPAILVMLSL